MNITLSIDEQLVERARAVAREQGTSLNALIREYLEVLAGQLPGDAVLRQFEAMWDEPGSSSGKRFDRDEVYADDSAAKTKRPRAREVISELIRERRAVVSTQVMQEYFVTAVKKLGMTAERARTRVEALHRLDVVVIRPELVLGAIDLHRLQSLSFWDALILKSASAAGCGRLLSEDLNDGQVIDGVTVENPF